MKQVLPNRLRRLWVQASLVVAAVTVLGTVLFLSLVLSNRIEALKTAPEDNTQWVLARLEVDFFKFQQSVEATLVGQSDLQDLRLKYDIFYSRVSLMEKGQATRWLLENRGDRENLAKLQKFLDETVVFIDGPDEALTASIPQIKEGLDRIRLIVTGFALSAIAKTADRSDANRTEIVRLLQVIGGALFLLFLALASSIIVLILQKHRLNVKTAEAANSNARLASTFGASLDAIVVLREDGEIVDFNGSAEKVFGLSHEASLGRDYFELLVPPQLRDTYRSQIKSQKDDKPKLGGAGRFQNFALHADGHEIPVEVSIGSAEGEDGLIYIAYLRDITEEMEKEEQLLVARDEALAAYNEKSKFLAVMSHEMRTPLNGLISALDLIRDTRLTRDQTSFLNAADTSAEILIGHVNDVLDIERIESARGTDRSEAVNLDELLTDTMGPMSALADQQQTLLHLERTGSELGAILIDRRGLQQILLNLLSNAIKFTPRGVVTLKANANLLPNDFVQLDFSVSDTGQGIDAKDQKRIFEDFVTVDSTYERRVQGTGLGLGIARRLAETLGGKLTCESELTKGSIFSFSTTVMHRAADAAPVAPAKSDAGTISTLPTKEILLVEDNLLNRQLLSRILTDLGQSVDEAADGFEGVQMASTKCYDLIFMDISMPNLNGVRATEMIRGSEGLSKFSPIYAVTAHALPDDKLRFARVGMAGTLTKPLRKTDVIKFLIHFDEQQTTQDPKSQEVNIVTDSNSVPLIDQDVFGDLKDIFGASIRTQIDTFISAISRDMEVLQATSDLATTQAKAHEMAGAAATFGAKGLHAQLAAIETACKTGQYDQARALYPALSSVWQDTKAAYMAV